MGGSLVFSGTRSISRGHDKWNLDFLAETKRQVEAYLDEHRPQLPEQDARSRAIMEQMKEDETRHAQAALHYGAASSHRRLHG